MQKQKSKSKPFKCTDFKWKIEGIAFILKGQLQPNKRGWHRAEKAGYRKIIQHNGDNESFLHL